MSEPPAAPPRGTLYLVPTPLDFGCAPAAHKPLSDWLPEGTLQTAARITHWITENAKSTRAFLKRVALSHPLAQPIQAQHIHELPRILHKKGDFGAAPPPERAIQALLQPACNGADQALVSEAGMPAVADPGALVVRAAHRLGVRVVPLVGPSSLLMALAASGLDGQHFAFVGYLPQDAAERLQAIARLEQRARESGQTQLLIETPFRNRALRDALLRGLRGDTWLAVSAGLGLSLPGHTLCSHSAPVSAWRADPEARLDWSLPALFAVGR